MSEEFILSEHYYPEEIEGFKRSLELFELPDWFKERIYRRFNNNELPKHYVMVTSNPDSNWAIDLYNEWKAEKNSPEICLIRKEVSDIVLNPEYIIELGNLDYGAKQKLLYGNWDIEDES